VATKPPTPSPFRERLLPTPANALDAVSLAALRMFCEQSHEVEVAYICASKRERDGEEPVQGLRFSVRLTTPVDQPCDSRDASHALAKRLAQSQPELMQQLGCGVLADRAVPAWDKNGLRVFSR
jgi:hypothetical protein